MSTNTKQPVIFSISIFIVLLLTSCAVAPKHNPIPEERLGKMASIPGIPQARIWGDEGPLYLQEWLTQSHEELMQHYSGIMGQRHNYLAISAGGKNGAFSAGILVGWTAAGTRPEFTMVTGISTGALAAPFAYLGSAYDSQLKEMYTSYSTIDFLTKRNILGVLTGPSLFDTEPLEKLIAKYIDQKVMEDIAAEHRKGRRLWIATTNLDAGRPMIWNIGAIASSNAPGSLELIHKVVLAAASIPGAFSPVFIEVETGGKRYNEMHVDGGVFSQIFVTPVNVKWREVARKLNVKGTPRAYLIRNSSFAPVWKTVSPDIASISGKTISLLVKTQGICDIYRIYAASKRDGIDFNLAYIPDDFDLEPKEAFDPVYMGKLFDFGYQLAKNGYPWVKKPPVLE